jgi:hypothetical protein
MSIAWREFSKAMTHLSGPGAQRERLALACGPALLGMKRKEIPREARADFDTLIHLMGADWARNAASAADLVDRLSDPEVAQAAAKVLAVYDQLTRYQPTRTVFDEMHGLPPGPSRRQAPAAGDEKMTDKQKNDDAQKGADEEQARC